MLTPQPLPDEIAVGYVGRIGALNGMHPGRAMRLVLNHAKNATGVDRGRTWLDPIAALAGRSLESFRYQHTVMPFYAAVQRSAWPSWADAKGGERSLTIAAHRGNAGQLALCPACVDEDIGYWGVSYWRRLHQLPGMVSCLKHRTGLLRIPESEDTVLPLPELALKHAKSYPRDAVDHASDSAAIQRYMAICAALLERTRPLTTHRLTQCLQDQAATLGLPRLARKAGTRVSQLTMAALGGPWQTMFFPELSADRSADFVNPIDYTQGNVKKICPTWYYALALTVLFDDADDALASAERTSVERGPNASEPVADVDASLSLAFQAFVKGDSLASASAAHSLRPEVLEDWLRQLASTHA